MKYNCLWQLRRYKSVFVTIKSFFHSRLGKTMATKVKWSRTLPLCELTHNMLKINHCIYTSSCTRNFTETSSESLRTVRWTIHRLCNQFNRQNRFPANYSGVLRIQRNGVFRVSETFSSLNQVSSRPAHTTLIMRWCR